jgi:hypothetical protein
VASEVASESRPIMAIGPVQLLVLGFNHPNFHGEIIEEQDAEGELEVAHLSNLTLDEARELGTKVGALVVLGIEGEEGLEKGAEAGVDLFSSFIWPLLGIIFLPFATLIYLQQVIRRRRG